MNKLATPAIEPRLITVPIERLSEATHGVRKTNGVSITELAASIAAEGLLQNLTVVVDTTSPLAGASEFEHYTVVAGCRRTRALRLLAKENRLPAELRDGIPCRLIDESQALTASLAENTVRQAMHPADEFVAFRDMIAQGKSVDDVSARFGVTPVVVQRRLKLAAVSPTLFEQFRKDKISLAQMMALALVDDHAAQEKAWGKTKDDWSRTPDRLREALTKTEIDASKDPIARFVGLGIYERAGGHVHRDLFSDQGAGYMTDKRLLQELATKKFAAIEARVRKEGWSFVEVRETISEYGDLNEYSRAEPSSYAKPDDAEKKTVKALKAERDEAQKSVDAAQQRDPEEISGEELMRLELIEARIDGIDEEITVLEQNRTKWDPKILAKGGAMIGLDRNSGNLVIYRGLIKGKLRQAKDKAAGKRGSAAAEKNKPGHSDALMRELSTSVSYAIGYELIANPGMAVIALAHRLALDSTLYEYPAHDDPVKIGKDRTWSAALVDEAIEGTVDAVRIAQEQAALQKLLPKSADKLLEFLVTASAGAPAQRGIIPRVIAYCVADSINVVTGREDDTRAAAIAAALKLNMCPRWTAKPDNYLKRVSSAQILAALKDVGADKTTLAKAAALKKGELVTFAQPLLATWLPNPLRFSTETTKTKERA